MEGEAGAEGALQDGVLAADRSGSQEAVEEAVDRPCTQLFPVAKRKSGL